MNCKAKECDKRHRRYCRYGPKCTYLRKNTCEYKHTSIDPVLTEKNTFQNVQKEAEKCQQESEAIRKEVEHLKDIIEKQKIQLKSLDKAKTNKYTNKISLLNSKIEILNKTINDDKIKFSSIIAQGKEELKHKDGLIKCLQKKVKAKSVVSEAVKETFNPSESEDIFTCELLFYCLK